MAFYLLISVILFLELRLATPIFVHVHTWDELKARLVWSCRNKTLASSEDIDWENKTIRLVVAENKPLLNYENGEFKGFSMDVWKTLEEHLKFKTTTIKAEFNHELEVLNRTKSDVILNPIDLNTMDLDSYDHTMPIATTWYNFFSKVGSDSGNSNFYMIIWSTRVRTLYYTTIFILALVFNRGINIWKRKGRSCNDSTFVCSLMHMFATVHNQGNQVIATKTSMRIIVLSAAFFGFFMSVSYSASLTSKLATKGIFYPEITFDTILKYKWALCVSVQSYAYPQFKNVSTNMVIDQWSSLLNSPPCSPSNKEKSRASLLPPEDFCHDRAIAFERHNAINYHFSNQPLCKTFKSTNRYFYTYLAMMSRKGFPLKKQINKSLLKYHMYGLIEKMRQKWVRKRRQERESAYQVTFRHVQSVLILYGTAITISAAIFLLELLVHRCNNLCSKLDEVEQILNEQKFGKRS